MLALGNLHAPFRTNLAFGIVFFATRVAFTGVLFVLLLLFNKNTFQVGLS
jgi:hypothetical protein